MTKFNKRNLISSSKKLSTIEGSKISEYSTDLKLTNDRSNTDTVSKYNTKIKNLINDIFSTVQYLPPLTVKLINGIIDKVEYVEDLKLEDMHSEVMLDE